jgi:predicted metal-dependent phosphoesterase TrpH
VTYNSYNSHISQSSDTADLHIHSTYSDGHYSPGEIVRLAKEANLKAIAITDHDTVAGLKEAKQAGQDLEVEVVSGVELSCELDSREIHMLGYFAPGREEELEDRLEWYQEKRQERVFEIIDKLARAGVSIDITEVRRFSTGKSIGRLHVAKALMDKGISNTVHEVFSRFLGPDGCAYVPKAKLTIEEAVEFIHEHQGVGVLAHPGMYRMENAAERTMEYLDGIEVWYPEHPASLEDHLYALALRNRLIPTGGSDFHGIGKATIGCVRIPYSTVTRILEVAVGV